MASSVVIGETPDSRARRRPTLTCFHADVSSTPLQITARICCRPLHLRPLARAARVLRSRLADRYSWARNGPAFADPTARAKRRHDHSRGLGRRRPAVEGGLPGMGNSSPVLWGDRMFLTSADVTTARGTCCACPFTTGSSGSATIPPRRYHVHQQNTFASSTPVADANACIAPGPRPRNSRWSASTTTAMRFGSLPLGPFVSQHGFATSPIVYRDLVILTNDQDGDSLLVAVDSRQRRDPLESAPQGAGRSRTPRTPRPALRSARASQTS